MTELPQGYQIRRAVQLDIPSMIAADQAASELFRPTGLVPDMAAIPESVPADIFAAAIEEQMVLAVTYEGEPVGFALCRVMEDTLYLDQISVDPAHGRKGLGRALMSEVEKLASQHSVSSVTLSTFRTLKWNGPFYKSLGFRELPRKKMSEWMLEIETAQAETLDVSQRCFMQRRVRRPLLRRNA